MAGEKLRREGDEPGYAVCRREGDLISKLESMRTLFYIIIKGTSTEELRSNFPIDSRTRNEIKSFCILTFNAVQLLTKKQK